MKREGIIHDWPQIHNIISKMLSIYNDCCTLSPRKQKEKKTPPTERKDERTTVKVKISQGNIY